MVGWGMAEQAGKTIKHHPAWPRLPVPSAAQLPSPQPSAAQQLAALPGGSPSPPQGEPQKDRGYHPGRWAMGSQSAVHSGAKQCGYAQLQQQLLGTQTWVGGSRPLLALVVLFGWGGSWIREVQG